ncbi:hypothetical protein FNO01nite_25870 [Flavobacterium noncentrifugens]|uniref:Uncharacterized protein n=1 Tax=Flavobacterium noncentrifugens TaxID=1128970 RepID=A0A1G8ZJP4_9FLAO|nr:hypothetical protein [Flavobacterium noncentrifugens]GEP51915.1 hypothetical protein FNO01nite_25870 [Flavobacterium noncentrifugens]SDK14814.1 hypothetical protein SAMN04487935_2612 [Flavobacterium noncentrifugens]
MILHDKQAMLDLENPRQFVFSKWTLREGWQNPNVFQICKLRSSGSEISKLQEIGRGLRLPVNEYGNRIKGEQFYLNYFACFTESDFVDRSSILLWRPKMLIAKTVSEMNKDSKLNMPRNFLKAKLKLNLEPNLAMIRLLIWLKKLRCGVILK